MQQGDIIRITDVQSLAGYTDPIRNVYYYRVFTMTAEAPLQIFAEDIASAFQVAVVLPLTGIQSVSLLHIELEFFNMSFQQEEATQTWDNPIAGLNSGDYMPANVAYSFKLQRYDRVVRNGAKRISGVPEAATTAGRTLNPTYADGMNAVVAALAEPIEVTGDVTSAQLVPTIVRVPANSGVTPTVYTTITEASFRGFGTQNTRKQL